jgi:2-methylcitrate dehydratase PrpD
MMDRVTLVTDPDLTSTDEPFVTVETQAGRRIEKRVTAPLGGPANPIGAAAHEAKIRQLAGMVLDTAGIDRLVHAIDGLEGAADIRAFPHLLTSPTAPTLFV